MRPLPYVPYGKALEGVPHVFVDSLRTPFTRLELSHWPGNGTPSELKADVSTQSVLGLLALGQARREELLDGATAVSCDHYDVDGLLSVWSLTAPDQALRHRDLVARTAVCGDFDMFTGAEPVRSCLALLAAEKAIQRSILDSAGSLTVEDHTGRLFAGVLEAAPDCLSAPQKWEDHWAQEWEQIDRSRRILRARPTAITEYPHLDLAVVEDEEEPLHEWAVHESTRALSVLLLRPDGRHSMRFRYESFVDLQSRTVPARVRGDVLAARLNEAENQAGCTWFCEPPSSATPLLQLYSESSVPAPSAIDADELRRLVVQYFVDADAEPALRWSPPCPLVFRDAGRPAFQGDRMKRVARIGAQLTDGRVVEVDTDDGRMLARLVDGSPVVHAFLCPHSGAPLSEAYTVAGTLVCSWHRSVFRGADGAHLYGPAGCGIAIRAASLDGDDLLIDDSTAG